MEHNGPDSVSVLFKCVGDGSFFQVAIGRQCSVSSAKIELARYLPPYQDFRLVFSGRTLIDTDNLAKIYLGTAVYVMHRQPVYIIFTDFATEHLYEGSPKVIIDKSSLDAAELWCNQCIQNGQESSSESVKYVVAFAKDNPTAVVVSDEFKPLFPQPDVQEEVRPALPPIPQPRWVDLYLIPKIVIGIYLFGANLIPYLQIALGVAYYLFDTGIALYLSRWICRRFFGDSLPLVGSIAESYDRIASFGLRIKDIARRLTATPASPGIFLDIFAFLSAFALCLYPGWRPVPLVAANEQRPQAQQPPQPVL